MTDPRTLDLPSHVAAVTLFEDRAEILRDATAELPEPGLYRIRLEGLTPFLDDRSLQVLATGAEVLSAQVTRRLVTTPDLDQDALRALEAEVRELDDRERAVHAQRTRAARQSERLKALFQRWIAGLTRVPRGFAEGVDPWDDSLGSLDDALLQLIADEQSANVGLRSAQRETARARMRLDQGGTLTQRVMTTAEIQVRAERPGPCKLRLTYRTPCALWRPEHALRLRYEDGEEPRVDLTTRGVIWQRTGERWEEVELRCSTARPAAAAEPPPLQEDRLQLRRKTPEEQRTIHVEVRDQTIALGGLASGSSNELPGVDDGGEPRVFTARSRVTLHSNGEPARVDLTALRLPAELQRVLIPERAPVAHLRVRATLPAGAAPLLAGPLQVARQDTFVGRARLKYVAPGERFEVGCGADDAVRVRRRVHEDTDSTVLGTQLRERRIELSLSNLSDTPRAIHIIERIPVSELDDITIHLERADGWTLDPQDGFLTRDLTLPPNTTERFDFTYRIKAGSNVALPF